MFGRYDGFPINVHKIANLTFSTSNRELQEKLTQVFEQMNCETIYLKDVVGSTMPNYILNFESGIAKAKDFTFLNCREVATTLEIITKGPLQVMDFYCALRYYNLKNGKKAHLRFDYYMIRFIFNKNSIEIRVFHERGPMYTSPTDVVDFIVKKINENSPKRILKSKVS